MILTENDRPVFLPTLAIEDEEHFIGVAIQAQAIAESHLGAHRPLEEQQHVEQLLVSSTSYLSNWPIGYAAGVAKLEIRGGDALLPDFGRALSWGQFPLSRGWQELPATDYEIELDTGLIEWKRAIAYGVEVRATYTGGFNFASPGKYASDVARIKSAIASILLYQQSAAGVRGLINSAQATATGATKPFKKKIEAVDDVAVEYESPSDLVKAATGSGAGSVLTQDYQTALELLKRYRSKSWGLNHV